MDCSMSGIPVLHQFLGLTQTHLHWVGDAIQPSHPLPCPSICVKHILWVTLSKVIEIGQSGGTEIYVPVYKLMVICHLLSRRLQSFDEKKKKKKKKEEATFNISQHQGLFQWVSFSHQVAKVLTGVRGGHEKLDIRGPSSIFLDNCISLLGRGQ